MTTIKSLLKTFEEKAKERNFSVWIDPCIESWIPNAIVQSTVDNKGSWTSVDTTKGTTEKEMLKTAQKICLSQAIQSFTAELEAGTFDVKETYRIIFITETDPQGNSLRITCFRHSVDEVQLYVCQVFPGYGCHGAGDAWLATRSETLKTENLSYSDTLTLERAIGVCVMNGYKVAKEK